MTKTIIGVGVIAIIILISVISSSKAPIPNSGNPGTLPSTDQSASVKEVLPSLPQTIPAPEPQQRCHPSYLGACLKIDASDYDCAGGSGNGPYYTGKVRVVGPDVFGLDRDGDGWGCE